MGSVLTQCCQAESPWPVWRFDRWVLWSTSCTWKPFLLIGIMFLSTPWYFDRSLLAFQWEEIIETETVALRLKTVSFLERLQRKEFQKPEDGVQLSSNNSIWVIRLFRTRSRWRRRWISVVRLIWIWKHWRWSLVLFCLIRWVIHY